MDQEQALREELAALARKREQLDTPKGKVNALSRDNASFPSPRDRNNRFAASNNSFARRGGNTPSGSRQQSNAGAGAPRRKSVFDRLGNSVDSPRNREFWPSSNNRRNSNSFGDSPRRGNGAALKENAPSWNRPRFERRTSSGSMRMPDHDVRTSGTKRRDVDEHDERDRERGAKRQRLSSAVAKPKHQQDDDEGAQNDEQSGSASRNRKRRHEEDDDREEEHDRDEGGARQDDEKRKQRAVAPYSQKDVVARSRRMFGALMGHLGKAKQRIEKDSDLFKRQDLRQHEADEREKQQSAKLERQMRRQLQITKYEKLLAKSDLDGQEEAARLKLKHLMQIKQLQAKSGFLQTVTAPCLYFLPKKLTQEQEELISANKEALNEKIQLLNRELQTSLSDLERENALKKEKYAEELARCKREEQQQDDEKAQEQQREEDEEQSTMAERSDNDAQLEEPEDGERQGQADGDEDHEQEHEQEQEGEPTGEGGSAKEEEFSQTDELPDDPQPIVENDTHDGSQPRKKEETQDKRDEQGASEEGAQEEQQEKTVKQEEAATEEQIKDDKQGESESDSEHQVQSPALLTVKSPIKNQNETLVNSVKETKVKEKEQEGCAKHQSAKVDQPEVLSTPKKQVKKSSATPASMKVTELRQELKRRGLDTKGLKANLVKRLEEAIQDEQA